MGTADLDAADLDTGVIVVGAGPVGLVLAGELRLGGADVIVLERLTAPRTESRASTLHARTMEVLDQRGLLAGLGPVPSDPAGHFGGIPLDFTSLATPFPALWKVPQAQVEELAGAWATRLGASVRRGQEVRALSDTGDYVEVATAGAGGPGRLRARYVVGCDGEDSAVRRLAGIDFPGHDASLELLRADVLGIDIPARRFQRLPDGLAISARRPDGVTRVMVHEFGRPAGPRGAPPAFAEVVKAWERVTGEDISDGEPLWLNAFGNISRQAQAYRAGRVLLAGDAAHAQLPVGGQALNLGLQDAVNLGWKLAAEAGGSAPAGLLDSYHDERHPVGQRVLGNIEAQALLLLGRPEVEPVRTILAELTEIPAVRRQLAGTISGLDVRYPAGEGGEVGGSGRLRGLRLPPGTVATAAGPVSTASMLRSGRGLLLDLSGTMSAVRTAVGRYPRASHWADRVDVVRAAPPSAGSPLYGTSGVLVRPDGHVAWEDVPGQHLETALRRWFGEPA